jgi:hypothetical protein
VAAEASAARPATGEENPVVSVVYATAPECSGVAASERNWRFGGWDFAVGADCQPTGDGFGKARRDNGGRWRGFYQARQSRRIYLTNYLNRRPLVRPRRYPYGAHAELRSLRWRGWNRRVARARGVMDYADRTGTFRAPILLRAFRVRRCGTRRIYSRLGLRFVRSAHRRRYRALEGRMRLPCPRPRSTASVPRCGNLCIDSRSTSGPAASAAGRRAASYAGGTAQLPERPGATDESAASTAAFGEPGFEAGPIRCTGSRGRVVRWRTAS